MALRVREEAERTIEKVEQLWRISSDNERLKAENEELRAERERARLEAGMLAAALHSVEEQQQGLLLTTVQAQLAVAQLETALASFRDGFNVGCSVLPGGDNERITNAPRSPGIPNRHRLSSSGGGGGSNFKSNSPRFGRGVELAMRGVLTGANAAYGEEARRRGDAQLSGRSSSGRGGGGSGAKDAHDLLLVPQAYVEALTKVLASGITLGRASSSPPRARDPRAFTPRESVASKRPPTTTPGGAVYPPGATPSTGANPPQPAFVNDPVGAGDGGFDEMVAAAAADGVAVA